MGKDSNIEWTDHTFNPWIGCTKVSPGCKNCYAEGLMDTRYGKVRWGKGQPRQRTSASNWKQPLTWNRNAGVTRPRVFCASLADWLDPEVPIEWLADLLDLIRQTPQLDWLLLTKRPELWAQRMNWVHVYLHKEHGGRAHPLFDWISDWKAHELGGSSLWQALKIPDPTSRPPANVWVGASVEDQQRADERIPDLLQIPARVRFLSCEPLLSRVDLDRWVHRTQGWRDQDEVYQCPQCSLTGHGGYFSVPSGGDDYYCECTRCGAGVDDFHAIGNIHWAICGGESGTNARPMHPDWARSLRDQCAAARMPFFFKQWGEFAPSPDGGLPDHLPDSAGYYFVEPHPPGKVWRFGKKAAGRLLDGVEHNEFPEVQS